MDADKKVQINLHLDPETKQALDDIAYRKRISTRELVRRIFDEWLEAYGDE